MKEPETQRAQTYSEDQQVILTTRPQRPPVTWTTMEKPNEKTLCLIEKAELINGRPGQVQCQLIKVTHSVIFKGSFT